MVLEFSETALGSRVAAISYFKTLEIDGTAHRDGPG